MEKLLLKVDWVSTIVGKFFGWAVIIMTAAICYEVFMRYVLRSPTTWAYDAGYMLYGALFIMAGAYALSTGAHARGDVIYRLFPIRVQASIDLILYLIFFFPAMIALLYAGYHYAEYSWRIGERSSASPAGPPLYHFKTLIPLSAAFLILQGLAELTRCVMCLKNGVWPARISDVKEVDTEAAKRMLGDAETQGVPVR
jgi:TRAP-type mannitol/chloroaromatic compound transport system permease small subunit